MITELWAQARSIGSKPVRRDWFVILFWLAFAIFLTIMLALAATGFFMMVCGCETQGMGPMVEFEERIQQVDTTTDTILTHYDTVPVTADTVDSSLTRVYNRVFDMNLDLMFAISSIAAARAECLKDSIAMIDSILADWEAKGLIEPEGSDE